LFVKSSQKPELKTSFLAENQSLCGAAATFHEKQKKGGFLKSHGFAVPYFFC